MSDGEAGRRALEAAGHFRFLLEQGISDLARQRDALDARATRLTAAAREVLKVNDGGPRAYDVGDWDAALDDLRRAIEPEEPKAE